jgi:hypothetical protein
MKRTMLSFGMYVLFFTGILYSQDASHKNLSDYGKKWTSSFYVDKRNFTDTGGNQYFILKPGYYLVLKDKEGDTGVELLIRVLNETKVIDGVTTRVVEERETHNGKLVEVSRNFYAIDKLTNSVFYFGEEVDIYKKGKIVSHEGSWRSGERGAKFGLMMPGLSLIGARYFQEIAEGVAMDRAEILSNSEILEVPAGTFTNCLKIEETTPLESGIKEYKYYAPGIGLIKDGSLELVKFGFEE